MPYKPHQKRKGTGAPKPKKKSKIINIESPEQTEQKFKHAEHQSKTELTKMNPSRIIMMHH
jgi:hypothetical protein